MNETLHAWLKASRLPSQLYIALPLLLGQVVASSVSGRPLHLGTLVLVQLFGVLDQLYIVYANDVADEATDATNLTFTAFSGGSRVLVEGMLTRRALMGGAATCALAMLGVTGALAITRNAPSLFVLATSALLLLQMYSFGPLRLSYRGGGELLQMLGVGLVLPLYGYGAQRGDMRGFPWQLLLPLLPAQLACALATALPDEPSDRVSAKRTLAVRIGVSPTARVVGALGVLAACLGLVTWHEVGGSAYALLLPGLLSALVFFGPASSPGSRGLTVRIALAIASTLSLVLVLTAWFARSAS